MLVVIRGCGFPKPRIYLEGTWPLAGLWLLASPLLLMQMPWGPAGKGGQGSLVVTEGALQFLSLSLSLKEALPNDADTPSTDRCIITNVVHAHTQGAITWPVGHPLPRWMDLEPTVLRDRSQRVRPHHAGLHL